jgi:hypothetical protein
VRLFERGLRIASPIAVHLVVIQNGVVAGITKNHGAQGAIRAAHGEYGNVLIDRSNVVAMANAAAIHGDAGKALLEAKFRRLQIVEGAADRLHDLVLQPVGVAFDDRQFGVTKGVRGKNHVADYGSAVRVGGVQQEPLARQPELFFDAGGDGASHLTREPQQVRADPYGAVALVVLDRQPFHENVLANPFGRMGAVAVTREPDRFRGRDIHPRNARLPPGESGKTHAQQHPHCEGNTPSGCMRIYRV